jgi:predicted small secreted protein
MCANGADYRNDALGRFIPTVVIALSLGGWDTVQGMGKDIAKGGEAVQDAARSVKQKI